MIYDALYIMHDIMCLVLCANNWPRVNCGVFDRSIYEKRYSSASYITSQDSDIFLSPSLLHTFSFQLATGQNAQCTYLGYVPPQLIVGNRDFRWIHGYPRPAPAPQLYTKLQHKSLIRKKKQLREGAKTTRGKRWYIVGRGQASSFCILVKGSLADKKGKPVCLPRQEPKVCNVSRLA